MVARFAVASILIAATVNVAWSQTRTPPRTPPRTATPPRARPDTTRRPTTRPDTTRRPAPRATAQRRPAPPPDEQTFAVQGGAARAGLGFGIGPSLGAVARFRKGKWPFALRGDAAFSWHSQTPSRGGVQLTETASLGHFGAGAGVEVPMGTPRATAPYLLGTVGVYRFAGSGPAGDLSDIPDGVFTGITDVALGIGGGVRFRQRFFLEARVLTVGDFTTVPVTVGYVIRR